MSEQEDMLASETVIEMKGVTVGSLRQSGVTVLEGVDWAVTRGEFWAVGGLHASGKSDLLALTGGLMPPVTGTFELFGQELKAGYRDEMLSERMRLGMVFDGGQLFSRMTVRENVALPLLYHQGTEGTDELIDELMTRVGLEDFAERAPGAITRGWRQRVGLARALALKPEVLLLDTPLTGLDPWHVQWWLRTLAELSKGHPWMNRRPVTLVVTCDDLRPWQSLANRFAMLKGKRFQLLGGRTEIRGETAHLAKDLLPEAIQSD